MFVARVVIKNCDFGYKLVSHLCERYYWFSLVENRGDVGHHLALSCVRPHQVFRVEKVFNASLTYCLCAIFPLGESILLRHLRS